MMGTGTDETAAVEVILDSFISVLLKDYSNLCVLHSAHHSETCPNYSLHIVTH
jgi:hypothetical protein